MSIRTAITSYLPPLWMAFEEPEELPEIIEGDLVEFDDYYDEYVGCGIIKRFTISEFKNSQTGQFKTLPCAIIVSANPDKDWLDYVPLTHIDPLSITDYIKIYEDEYGQLSSASRMQLRRTIATQMSQYSRAFGLGNMPCVHENKTTLPMGA